MKVNLLAYYYAAMALPHHKVARACDDSVVSRCSAQMKDIAAYNNCVSNF